jgi:hypothetical protein
LVEWPVHSRVLSRLQAGFVNNKRKSDSIFITKSAIDKHLSVKIGRIYWCFFDLEKTFSSVNREALWCKTLKKGVSRGIVGWVERMHEVTEFCLRWNRDDVREPIPQEMRAVGSSTTNGLPQGIKQIVTPCKYWGLKYNITKM